MALLALALSAACLTPGFGQAERVPGTSYATALELAPGEHSFNLERGDSHYFSVRLEKDDTLYLLLRSALNQDFDMALISPDREVIELSVRAAGFAERITYTAASSGLYYIVVFPFGPSSGAYSLIVSVSKPRVATVTTTVTALSYVTVTQRELRDVLVVMTRESIRTMTLTTEQKVERDFELLGWSVLSLAMIAVAALIRDGLVRSRFALEVRKEGEGKEATETG